MPLPERWSEARVGAAWDVLIGCQRNPARAAALLHVPYLRSANVLSGYLDLSDVLTMGFTPSEQRDYALLPGDVLVTEGSASPTAVGAPAAWNGEIGGVVCFQNTVLRFRAKPGITVPRFVYHWARHAHESGRYRQAAGSSILHLGAKRTSSLGISLPRADEQAAIAQVLDQLDRAIEAANAEVSKLIAIGHGLRHDFFGSPDRIAPLEEVGALIGGSTPSRGEPSFWGGDIPWVTPTDITALDGTWLWTTREHITDAGLASSAARLLPAGAILITTRATIGAVALAAVPVSTNQGFRSLVCNDGSLPNYYYHVVRYITPELIRRASGSTFLEIGRADMARIPVPRPSLPDQRVAARVLDQVDVEIAAAKAAVEKLRRLRTGALDDLITGRRRLSSYGYSPSEVA